MDTRQALENIKYARQEWRAEKERYERRIAELTRMESDAATALKRIAELTRMESDAATALNKCVREVARYRRDDTFMILHDGELLRAKIVGIFAKGFVVKINEGLDLEVDEKWAEIVYQLNAHDGMVYYRPFALTEAQLAADIESYNRCGWLTLPIAIGGDPMVYRKHVKTEAEFWKK